MLISSCNLEKNGNGIEFIDCNNISVSENEIHYSHQLGLIGMGSNNNILNNNITKNRIGGIVFENGMNNTIFGNNVDDNDHGIFLEQNNFANISQNSLNYNNKVLIWVNFF